MPKWLRRLLEVGVHTLRINTRQEFMQKTYADCVREVEAKKKKRVPSTIRRHKRLRRVTFSQHMQNKVLTQLEERREALVQVIQALSRRQYEIESAIVPHYCVHVLGQHVIVTTPEGDRITYAVVGISYKDVPPYYVLWCRKQITKSSYSAEVYCLSRPDKLVGIQARDVVDTSDVAVLRYHDLARFRKGFKFPHVHAVDGRRVTYLYPPSTNDVSVDSSYDLYPKINVSPNTAFTPSIVDDWIVTRMDAHTTSAFNNIRKKRVSRDSPTSRNSEYISQVVQAGLEFTPRHYSATALKALRRAKR